MSTIAIIPVSGVPEVSPGDHLDALLLDAIDRLRVGLKNGDVLVVCQKIVSKAQGRIVDLKTVAPSAFAQRIGAQWDKDPRLVEVVLRESRRIVRMKDGVVISETGPGWVCANAGVDTSNSPGDDIVVLLPQDADGAARELRTAIMERRGVEVAVVVTDTFGRPWREGLVEFALGVAGLDPLLDLRGNPDRQGMELRHTVVAVADELASAAGLVMEKGAGIPAVIVRGYKHRPHPGGAHKLIRPPDKDLFR